MSLVSKIGTTLALSSSLVLATPALPVNVQPTVAAQEEIDYDVYLKYAAYTNVIGEPLFDYDDIKRLAAADISTEYLDSILSLQSNWGSQIFDDAKEIVMYSISQPTIDPAVQLSALENSDGHTLFYDGSDILAYLFSGNEIGFAEYLANMRNDYGYSLFDRGSDIAKFALARGTEEVLEKLRELQTADGDRIFDEGQHIASFLFRGGTVDYAKQLTVLKTSWGSTIFSRDKYIARFIERQGTVEEARELANLRTNSDRSVYDAGWKIWWHKWYNLNVDDVRELLTLETNNQRTVFRDGYHIVRFLVNGGTLQDAERFLKLRNAKQKTLFTRGRDIATIFSLDISLDEVEGLRTAITKNDGTPFFDDARDIARFMEEGGTIDYAKEFAEVVEGDKHKFSSFDVSRFLQLHMSIEEVLNFVDTEKPNALLVYPAADWNGAFENRSSNNLYELLKREYDVVVTFASTEDDMYEQMERMSNIDLLAIGGHGSQQRLLFGHDYILSGLEQLFERFMLDFSDDEFAEYCNDYVAEDGKIVLLSCSTGEGGLNADNLANYIISLAGNRQVIAAQDVIPIAWFDITSVYPFECDIVDPSTRQNLYYSNK